ncbi:unnamed protein product [Arabidopsis thaliana]|uniref:(thale cress) hypothetical protein n=1 Tax=Arabidopsis thaliana TaxID=3702 RepID=A0A7G2ECJ3_ARATH|nr:unnamed protein product [Arabidopsis thaliana]
MRKRSFKQRREGFLKKLNDLKVLCDVNACAVVYNPFNSNPDVWPSKSEVNNIIKKFEMLPETQKKVKSVNHEEFLNLYISKVEKQSKKLIVENKETCLKEVMFKCLGGNMGDFVMNDNDRLDLWSSSSFLNSPLFNSPQLTNELQLIVSQNHRLENSLASNLFFGEGHDICIPAMNQSIIPSNQRAEHVDFLESNFLPNNNQEVYIPVMDQDEVYYPNQNHYENQKGFIDEMMKYAEKTSFPWMVENHCYNHNQ